MGIKKGRRKALILGIDGYIGWALNKHLSGLGYEVSGIDSLFRRDQVESLIPISDDREFERIGLRVLVDLPDVDVVIHLAEQPSAPYSMDGRTRAWFTQSNNILGTLNLLWLMKRKDIHLVKLGTMGEYGTPPCDIPEGFIEDGPMKGMMFPRQPGSFYHLSKVIDSMNIEFACRMWGLKSTDIMQGVVFGHEYDTRFDYDEHFGTVINRFCIQAIAGIPLTVYGRGGQTRGYLPLKDSLECITLAIENPPKKGEYRVFNQYAKIRSVNELAIMVAEEARKLGIDAEIKSIPNPRIEKEHHAYETKNDNLRSLGYDPQWSMSEEIGKLLKKLLPYKDRINKDVIMPVTNWR